MALEELRSRGRKFVEKRAEELSLSTDGNRLCVPFFGKPVFLNLESLSFEDERSLMLTSRIIILHYILKGGKSFPRGEWINYRSVPGGLSYYDVFKRRALKPLLVSFKSGSEILSAALSSGWRKENFGDASASIVALPRVPLLFVYWEGDEEFEPSVDMLFDKTIVDFLPSEDVVKLSKIAALKILSGKRCTQ